MAFMGMGGNSKPCPDCGAQGAADCFTKSGKKRYEPHLARRVRNAKVVQVEMPAWQKEMIARDGS